MVDGVVFIEMEHVQPFEFRFRLLVALSQNVEALLVLPVLVAEKGERERHGVEILFTGLVSSGGIRGGSVGFDRDEKLVIEIRPFGVDFLRIIGDERVGGEGRRSGEQMRRDIFKKLFKLIRIEQGELVGRHAQQLQVVLVFAFRQKEFYGRMFGVVHFGVLAREFQMLLSYFLLICELFFLRHVIQFHFGRDTRIEEDFADMI